MAWRWLDHTAELGLELEATSAVALFAEAAAALGELIGREGEGEPADVSVEVTGADHAMLLVSFLEELLYLAETRGFVPASADPELGGSMLRARIRGRTGAPSPLVKAVTLHKLRFERENGGWRAHVVLDV